MNNFITVSGSTRKGLQFPSIELLLLPTKLSKRLWIEPAEMVRCVQAFDLDSGVDAKSNQTRDSNC
jgi:hypothetical protein